nr:hypothetical protein [Tanacetum cinerariifolium]
MATHRNPQFPRPCKCGNPLIDPELNNGWYKNQMIELYLALTPDESKGLCLICGNNHNSLNDSPSISDNSSQSPLHINHHYCYECGDSLDGIFCHQCTCESCGKGAHYGYNCPPKVLIIPNPEPFNNQTIDELPQTLLSFDSTCYPGNESPFTYDSTPNIVDYSPNVFNPPL